MDRREFLKSGSFGLGGLLLGGASLSSVMQSAIAASMETGEPWKFGVMADSQWTNKNDPASPATCAVNIIQALNQQFIAQGVKFVVQVGDLCDSETWTVTSAAGYVDPFGNAAGKSVRTMQYRAWAAQSLYDAGIGFLPLRGNHEASSTAANDFVGLFPQTQGNGSVMAGVSNIIPSSIPGLVGLSYAFDVGNVRIVLLDQFTRKDGTGTDNNSGMLDQVGWVDSTLANRSSDMHAVVMGHKNLVGGNHTDCLFGANPGTTPTQRDAFISSLQANRTGFYLGGHDHMHLRSIISTADKTARTEQVICASNSYKFYIPQSGASINDVKYDSPTRETVIAQELFTIGYYIFTIDGPCVTVDFYSSSHGQDYGDTDLQGSPAGYAFYKRERFGYSLNGQQFVVPIGGSYTGVQDAYKGTIAKILSGANGDAAAIEYDGRTEVKTVKTGWKDMPAGAASAVLKLWGLDNNLDLWNAALTGLLPNSDADYVTDTYVLSLSYDPALVRPTDLGTGFCLAARDAGGNWTNAVNLNEGGTRKLVIGAYKGTYGLGTYGVDPVSHTVWAVLNRDGEFVARKV
jgi:hypothetical protein